MRSISDDSIDTAVLRLFRERAGCGCGTRILYAQLERRWRRSGLRRSDLAQAIERLERGFYLRVIHDATPGPDVELLLPGFRRLVPSLLSAGDWMAALDAVRLVLRAHWRRTRIGRRSERRRSDPP